MIIRKQKRILLELAYQRTTSLVVRHHSEPSSEEKVIFDDLMKDLNVVRTRASLDSYTGPMSAGMIQIERMKELVFEDDRLYYLQATQQEIPNGDRGPGSIPWTSRTWQSIPQIEIDLNPNITRE